MRITRILLNEHRIIEQVLNCLERMADRCEFYGRLENRPARDAIAFLRSFVERCHDRKVETRLIPVIQATGVPVEQFPGCPLRQSRKDARLHLDAMEAVIEPACAGSAPALDRFAEHARAYIDVLLDCIARQEDCLFPLFEEAARDADGVLPESGDRECGGYSACNNYIEVANALAEQFGVPRAVVTASGDGVEGRAGAGSWRKTNR